MNKQLAAIGRGMMSTAEAGARLGVTAETIREYIHQGRLRCVRLSRSIWKIRYSDLDKFIAGNMEGGCHA